MIKSKHTITDTIEIITLSGTDILDLLMKDKVIDDNYNAIDVVFKVPTGGDWSGSEVDVCIENPIIVKIYRKESKSE